MKPTNIIIFLSIALCLLNLSSVNAASWVYVGSTPNLDRDFFIDSDTIERQGDTLLLWDKIVYYAPEKNNNITMIIGQLEFLVPSNRVRILSQTQFDADNHSHTFDNDRRWYKIIPGTMDEAMLKKAIEIRQ